MTVSALKYALTASVLLNVGVLGAVAYTASQQRHLPSAVEVEPNAVDYLKLTPAQRTQWHALEADFVRDFQAGMKDIEIRREKLIHAVFSERPNAEQIDAEREAIAKLQTQQQKRVIEQLLKERAMLDSSQQRALAELLLRQTPAASAVERVHRQ